MSRKRPLPQGVKFYSEQAHKVFKGIRFDVYQWEQKQFDGSEQTFETVRRQDNVFVLPVVDNNIVVVKEKQPHWEESSLNSVTGLLEDGENILDGAKRELEEETGLVFKNFYLVHMEQPNVSAEWISYTIVATDHSGEKVSRHLDVGEESEVVQLSIDEYLETVKKFGFKYRQRFAEDYLIADKKDEFVSILQWPKDHSIPL